MSWNGKPIPEHLLFVKEPAPVLSLSRRSTIYAASSINWSTGDWSSEVQRQVRPAPRPPVAQPIPRIMRTAAAAPPSSAAPRPEKRPLKQQRTAEKDGSSSRAAAVAFQDEFIGEVVASAESAAASAARLSLLSPEAARQRQSELVKQLCSRYEGHSEAFVKFVLDKFPSNVTLASKVLQASKPGSSTINFKVCTKCESFFSHDSFDCPIVDDLGAAGQHRIEYPRPEPAQKRLAQSEETKGKRVAVKLERNNDEGVLKLLPFDPSQ